MAYIKTKCYELEAKTIMKDFFFSLKTFNCNFVIVRYDLYMFSSLRVIALRDIVD